MLNRLWWNCVILVPSLVLQEQWKNRIKDLFLSDSEDINDFVSTSTDEIKKINILTYQALTQTWETDDYIIDKVIKNWYEEAKEDFESFEDFKDYLEELKEEDIQEYSKNIKRFEKREKNQNNVEWFLSKKVLNYFEELKNEWINSILVDEAHHLTNWWSSCVYYLWEFLGKNFIVWLTATPPFDDSDFYIVDENYSKLLWESDYYIPQPAVVKSWRLAPYQDLVYFVEPTENIWKILKKYKRYKYSKL